MLVSVASDPMLLVVTILSLSILLIKLLQMIMCSMTN